METTKTFMSVKYFVKKHTQADRVAVYNGNSIKTFRLVKHFAKNVKKKHKKHTQAVRVALYNGNYIKHLCLKMFCKKPTNADQVAVHNGNNKKIFIIANILQKAYEG